MAFVKVMLSHGHNPAQRLWVQAIDVDRTAALMCYLQMSLWHIPGVVVVGNSLSLEVRERFYTPAHYLGLWNHRLSWHEDHKSEHVPPVSVAARTAEQPKPTAQKDGQSIQRQFDFGF